MLKLYTELAEWWPLLSPPEEYAEETALYMDILKNARLPAEPTLLELGCGGGHTASHLKRHFTHVTLTDLSPNMLAMSRALNPECEHMAGDMRTLRLGRLFDVVMIHDAICYMTTPDDLRKALVTASAHCRPGGLALFMPDYVRETFQPHTEHGGSDGDGRGMRYLEWDYDPDEGDTQYVAELVYVLREGASSTRAVHDQHICGLFPRAEWLRLLDEAGFTAEIIADQDGRDLFLGRKR